jgi:hypothetical protein
VREPDVTITDYLLTLEALAFALVLARSPGNNLLQRWFIVFFAATAAASLAGGTVHGFFSDSRLLWRLVLIALGVVSAAAWAIGAQLLLEERVARVITLAAWAEFAVYALLVAFWNDSFLIAIANYLPSTLFLLAAFFVAYRANPAPALALGLGGLLLTLVAAVVQQARIALHPTYFNHNALYHVLQAIALFMIFRSAVFLASPTGP